MKVCHKSGWVSDRLVDADEEFQLLVVTRSVDVAEVRRRHPDLVKGPKSELGVASTPPR